MPILTYDSEAEWVAARDDGLGASETASVVGANPYSSPLDVWSRKRGEIPPVVATNKMKAGNIMERGIGVLFSAFKDRSVAPLKLWAALVERNRDPAYLDTLSQASHVVLTHPDHPWLRATLDFVSCDGSGQEHDARLLEVKLPGWPQSQNWNEDASAAPLHYVIQCQHQLFVYNAVAEELGWPKANGVDLVAYFGSDDLRTITVEANEAFHVELVQTCGPFFESIQSGTPRPKPGRDDNLLAMAQMRHPTETAGTMVEVEPDLMEAVIMAQRDLKDAKTEEAFQKGLLAEAIGDAELAAIDGVPVATYKVVERAAYTRTVKASSSRCLTVKKNAATTIGLSEA